MRRILTNSPILFAVKMPQAVTNVDRERLISCFERDEDYVNLAASLGINRRTAHGIITTFVRTGRRQQLTRGGSTRRVFTEEMREALVQFVEDKPTATLNEMRVKLLELFPHSPVSNTTISRNLDASLITLKLLRTTPTSWNMAEVKEERHAFAEWMVAAGIHKNLIFVDECGYNLWTARTQGRSARGARAVRVACSQRGQNLTLCLAVSPSYGLVHHMLLTGGMSKDRFSDFVGELSQLLHEEARVCVIYDNAPPHRDPPGLQKDDHEQRALPRYSPFLNIAENAISALKSAVKRRLTEPGLAVELSDQQAAQLNGRSLHQHRLSILRGIIESELPVITQQKCRNWYEHMTPYLPRCMQRADILT